MSKIKTYKFKVYAPGATVDVTLDWETDDPQGAMDRMHDWMERSSKLRVNRFENEWESFKMITEAA